MDIYYLYAHPSITGAVSSLQNIRRPSYQRGFGTDILLAFIYMFLDGQILLAFGASQYRVS